MRDYILQQHLAKYPEMQIQDMLKLLYQREFAGGHIIKDANSSFQYLISELNEIEPDNNYELFEDIGKDYVRVNLQAFKYLNLNPVKLNEVFVKSANANKGTIENFENSILELKSDPFLENYHNEVLHHSSIYVTNYNPHYRVIQKIYKGEIYDK
jgi:hypothetical protein